MGAFKKLVNEAYDWLVENDQDFELLGLDQRGEKSMELANQWVAEATKEVKEDR